MNTKSAKFYNSSEWWKRSTQLTWTAINKSFVTKKKSFVIRWANAHFVTQFDLQVITGRTFDAVWIDLMFDEVGLEYDARWAIELKSSNRSQKRAHIDICIRSSFRNTKNFTKTRAFFPSEKQMVLHAKFCISKISNFKGNKKTCRNGKKTNDLKDNEFVIWNLQMTICSKLSNW